MTETDFATRVAPRIEVENPIGLRLQPEHLPSVVTPSEPSRTGTLGLVAWGAGVLTLGLSALSIGNFIADQFARAPWLGWLTTGVAVTGAGLIASAIWRELSFLHRLDAVDRLRADLSDPARAKHAAKTWLASLPHSASIAPALDAASSPEAINALLRAGPAHVIAEQARALGQTAAAQMLAVTAAVPSPALDGLIVTLRGIRLVRQVAALYGFRPAPSAPSPCCAGPFSPASMSPAPTSRWIPWSKPPSPTRICNTSPEMWPGQGSPLVA